MLILVWIEMVMLLFMLMMVYKPLINLVVSVLFCSEVLGCCFLFVTYLFYVSFGRRQAVRFHMTPIIYRTVMDNNKGIASGGLFVKGSKW